MSLLSMCIHEFIQYRFMSEPDIDNIVDTIFYGSDADSDSDSDIEVPTQVASTDIVLGIDLGTTNTCVGIWRNHRYEIIPDSYGEKTIPSIVSFTALSTYIGKDAKNQVELNPENSIYEVKRLIGRKIDDSTVKADVEFLSYAIDSAEDGAVIARIITPHNGKTDFLPEEISAMILMEAKKMAHNYLRRDDITKAVITVPAYFNDSQRQATKDAGQIAGLEVLRIISEPTAAALSYGMERIGINNDRDMNILVYDFGGGTLDVSVVNISGGVFEVLASSGNTHLGGADFDNRLVTFCLSQFKKTHHIAELKDLSSMSYQRLRKSCESAKKVLSSAEKATIAVKDFHDGKNLLIRVTRAEFEALCRDIFLMCLHLVEDALASCELERDDIDEVILVGGTTRMPIIRNNLKLFFNGKEPNSSINPDEVVAVGAAIQGHILAHTNDPFSDNVVLLDIIPLSLGVETIGGVMTILIPRNSVIPIKRTKKFTTDSDNETSIEVKVFEGERKMTKDNFFVGSFILSGLEEAPRGVAQIEITFAVDINGIINVTAKDLKNVENKKTITITGNKGRLSSEQIEDLVRDARSMELKDKLERKKKQMFYEIEDLISNVQSNLDCENLKMRDIDKQKLRDDSRKIMEHLTSKTYDDWDDRQLEKILGKIKKRYGTLIIKAGTDDSSVKSTVNTGGIQQTTVYNEDDDETEEQIYDRIEEDEIGIAHVADEEKRKEIRDLRTALVDLCHSVFDIVSTGKLSIDDEELKELKNYIDDVLLWVHVKEKLTANDYRHKMDELNDICDNIIEKTNKEPEELFIQDETTVIQLKRGELECLTYSLKASIDSNMFTVSDDSIQKLQKYLENVMDWLVDVDIQIQLRETHDMTEDKLQEHITQINTMCEDIHNALVDVRLDNIKYDITQDHDTEDGTDLSKLKSRRTPT